MPEDVYRELVDTVRLWMLVPKSKNAYVPGFEGTFGQALDEALNHAAFWKTPYAIWEANPEKYRREGGLKRLWAEVRVPPESPLRSGE